MKYFLEQAETAESWRDAHMAAPCCRTPWCKTQHPTDPGAEMSGKDQRHLTLTATPRGLQGGDGKRTLWCSAGSAKLRLARLAHHLPWTAALEEPEDPTAERLRDLQLASAFWHPSHLLTRDTSVFRDRVKNIALPQNRLCKACFLVDGWPRQQL